MTLSKAVAAYRNRDMYASLEAEAFGRYLANLGLKVPQLAGILGFERAVLATLVDRQSRVVPFEFEPWPLLRALAEGRLPEEPGQAGVYEIELTPDGLSAMRGSALDEVDPVLPFH